MCDRKVHVGQLSFATTEAQLGEAMAQYGPVREIAMPRDKDTGKFRGFAFVTFADAAAAQRLMWDAQQGRVVIDGRVVTANTPTPLLNPTAAARSARQQAAASAASAAGGASGGGASSTSSTTTVDTTPRGMPVSNRVFVGGLTQMSAVDVRAHFEACGRIVECEVPIDRRTGRMRGFAFITFASDADAMRLVGTTAVVAGHRVEIKRADPKPLAALRHASSTHGGSDICGPSTPHDREHEHDRERERERDHTRDRDRDRVHPAPAPAPGSVRYDRGRGFTPYPATAMLQSVSQFVPQTVAPAPFIVAAAPAPAAPVPQQQQRPQQAQHPQPQQMPQPQYILPSIPPPGQPGQPVYYVIPQQPQQMPQPQPRSGMPPPPQQPQQPQPVPYQLAYMPVGMPPGAVPAPAAYFAPQMQQMPQMPRPQP